MSPGKKRKLRKLEKGTWLSLEKEKRKTGGNHPRERGGKKSAKKIFPAPTSELQERKEGNSLPGERVGTSWPPGEGT